MSSVLKLDNTEFDLNVLFNFNYNFEVLKNLLDSIARHIKGTDQKVKDLEVINVKKDKTIENLEKQLNTLSGNTEKRFKNIEIALNNFKKESLSNNTSNVDITGKLENNASTNNLNLALSPSTANENRKSEAKSPKEKEQIQSKKETLEDINKDDEKEILNTEDSRRSKKTIKSINREGADTQDIIHKMVRKIAKLEEEVEEWTKTSKETHKDFIDFRFGATENLELIHQHNNTLKTLTEHMEYIMIRFEPMKENLEQLNVKVMDFNIYDLFKSMNGEGGGSVDAATILVQNLDSKITQKLQFIDKRIKVLDEDSFKNKNEFGNLKGITDGLTRGVNNIKEEIEKLNLNSDSMYKELKDKDAGLETQLKEINDKLLLGIEEGLKEMRELMSQKDELMRVTEESLATEMNKNKSPSQAGLSENDVKLLKEMTKRIHDLEKSFKVFNANINVDFIKSEFLRISEGLNNKPSLSELHEVQENVNAVNHQVNFVKDTMSSLLEDRKILNDVNWLRKKVESIASTLLTLKNPDEINGSLQIKGVPIDTSKYLESNIFTEFQKGYNRELDGMRRDTDDLKRLLDDIVVNLKTKATDKDLKNLEEYLVTKLEELRLNANKKFADKLDTQKNIKYLDTQVKHIIDVYIRKMEKGDNWLIAKKPVNGYTCASCESYIGDLQDKAHDYVPWNKYPIRDPNEKAYRIGNGFSRMLQMLNVDVKKGDSNIPPGFNEAVNVGEASDDELRRSHSNYHKKELVLPNVVNVNNMNNKVNLNMSADNIQSDDELKKDDDPYQPRIVKIYKKVKPNANNGGDSVSNK